jgi:hypothetical protein
MEKSFEKMIASQPINKFVESEKVLHKNTKIDNFLGKVGLVLVHVITHSTCKLHLKFALLIRLYLRNSHSTLTSPVQDVCPFMYRLSHSWLITLRGKYFMGAARLEARVYAIIKKFHSNF